MTAPIDVDGLRFDFDDSWIALKWDEHPAYRSGLNGHQGTKAIDILALHNNDELWLIEAGDIRARSRKITHKNKRRERDELLEDEFSGKVRDTLASATWAQARHPDAVDVVRYLRSAWRGPAGKVQVALWFEGIDEAQALPLEDAVRARLKWLNPKVRILNAGIAARHARQRIQGLTVSNMAVR